VPTDLVHAVSSLLRMLAELTATALVALAMAALLGTGARLATLLERRRGGARTHARAQAAGPGTGPYPGFGDPG
jgi:hypothetical protein